MDPLALLKKLTAALDVRQKAVAQAEAWWSGEHPIPAPPPNTAAATDAEAKRAFEKMARLGVTNFLAPVVDVPAAKLRVEGFRFGQSPTGTDSEAWEIWQRNHLDADSDMGNHTALKTGQTFALVWAGADGKAEITIEDPAQTIVMYAAGSRRRRAAGLKRWVGEDGRTCATLYLPDAIYKYRSTSAPASGLVLPSSLGDWEPREVAGEEWPLPNPLGEVPLVEGRANAPMRASQFGGGVPEFQKQINEQRRINQTVVNMLVTMDYQSFRQRWVTGWDYPTNPDGTADKAALQKASAARLWTFKDENVKVGEFSQADLRPFLDAVTAWVKVIASTSGTPPYAFLLGDMINVAADSLARIEGIQTGKVKAHARAFGDFWAKEVMRLALKVEQNPKAADPSTSVVWGEFEERTATEQGNLATIFKNLGAPLEVVFAMLPGVSQQEAARWVTQQAADAILGTLATGGDPSQPDFGQIKAQADAFAALFRAGVDPEDAASRVGLEGLKLSGGVPITLRFPNEVTEDLGLEDG